MILKIYFYINEQTDKLIQVYSISNVKCKKGKEAVAAKDAAGSFLANMYVIKGGTAVYREQTKVVKIGDRVIGGGNPILIQSMTNTKTEDVEATVAQILELEAAGCDIIRSTVPTLEAAKALGEIKKEFIFQL